MRTRVLTITLAAVLALAGVVAILAYVRGANERAVNGLKAETVWVAAQPIAACTSLAQAEKQKELRTEDVPESSLANAGPAVRPGTQANGPTVVTSAMATGQVLLQNMLASACTGTASNGSLAVPSKMMAISVDVCVPEAVAGYVTPGTDVAVFDALIPDADASGETPSCSSDHSLLGRSALTGAGGISAVLVLPSVEVLAVGQNSGTTGSTGSAAADSASAASAASSSGGEVVTFAVNEQQAEQFIVLQQAGVPYLALIGSGVSMSASPGLGQL